MIFINMLSRQYALIGRSHSFAIFMLAVVIPLINTAFLHPSNIIHFLYTKMINKNILDDNECFMKERKIT